MTARWREGKEDKGIEFGVVFGGGSRMEGAVQGWKKNVELNQNLWGEKDGELEGSEGVFKANGKEDSSNFIW